MKASSPYLFQFLSAYSTHQNIIPLDEVEAYIENLDVVTSSKKDGKTQVRDEIASPFSMLITGHRESFSPGLFLFSSSASSIEIEANTHPHIPIKIKKSREREYKACLYFQNPWCLPLKASSVQTLAGALQKQKKI